MRRRIRCRRLDRCRGRCMPAGVPGECLGNLGRANHSAVGCRGNRKPQQLPPSVAERTSKCRRVAYKGNHRNYKKDQSTRPRQRGCCEGKVFHVCDGRPRLGTMYFETVDRATPSRASEARRGCAAHPRAGSRSFDSSGKVARTSCRPGGRPPRGRFPSPNAQAL